MYRSSSWSRITDGYYPSPKAGNITGMKMSSSMDDNNELPVYDPNVEMANKKDRSRAKFAENAVHIIPLVLLLCALILWFFSNPDVDVGTKVETVAEKLDGLTIEGDIDHDSDGTQTGFLPMAEPKHKNHSRKLHMFLNPQFID
ncbi:oxidoreductase family protein [Hibiscus syriacus]|uniref:Oxidoreductase family protein n=1 Tax=Hibiscus syriacus TaxID=106335 RepID=A0A6A3D0J1_HIBSY|nr:uncharacterized protein LOC120208626 [Hibiscus syriacus]KAE8734946.1 oxidoreductase family protein [Hibiscus syriacus]